MTRAFLFSLGWVLALGMGGPNPTLADDPDPPASEIRSSFTVQFGDQSIAYRVMGVFVIPGETTTLSVPRRFASGPFQIEAAAGTVVEVQSHTWRWTAPDAPGLVPLRVTHQATGEVLHLNAFVLTPFDHRKQSLNGYRIGSYRAKPPDRSEAYTRPKGFVELTAENADVRVSPHFTLGQFRCKQSGSDPQYLLLRTKMLRKLELILQAVNERGHDARSLHVMSGFRTPYYNRAIGNTTSFSRHLYGGASDVFVDTDGDGVMDDLNGDGRSTKADARELVRLVERLMRRPEHRDLRGGLSAYGSNSAHGPFVHVDVRGTRARW